MAVVEGREQPVTAAQLQGEAVQGSVGDAVPEGQRSSVHVQLDPDPLDARHRQEAPALCGRSLH